MTEEGKIKYNNLHPTVFYIDDNDGRITPAGVFIRMHSAGGGG